MPKQNIISPVPAQVATLSENFSPFACHISYSYEEIKMEMSENAIFDFQFHIQHLIY